MLNLFTKRRKATEKTFALLHIELNIKIEIE